MKGDIILPGGEAEALRSGIVLDRPNNPIEVLLEPANDELVTGNYSLVGAQIKQGKNAFLIRFWEGEMSVDLNERPVRPPMQVEKGFPPKVRLWVGLCTGGSRGEEGVKFSNLQIRRLSTKPFQLDGTTSR
jgi:hypothetical protein